MINIIQQRKYAYAFSVTTTVLSILAIIVWGLNFGIDFKGGTLMEVRFTTEQVPETAQIQETLAPLELKSLTIQPTEEKGMILRYLASDDEANNKVLTSLQTFDPNVTQIRTDFVGGSVSNQITRNALTGTIMSIIAIALFIAYAFRGVSGKVTSFEYGIGAVIALAHDIIVTVGVFAFLGHYYGVEVGVPFIAALLTILGYSVNDTIVVYDRIRENLTRSAHKENFELVVNRSLNETLGRSINTSLTVIITLIAIVLFGGESIKYFGVALLTGVAFGTYSSIYVSSALLVTRYNMKKKMQN
jgi:preprotein translocase subunit SecF